MLISYLKREIECTLTLGTLLGLFDEGSATPGAKETDFFFEFSFAGSATFASQWTENSLLCVISTTEFND